MNIEDTRGILYRLSSIRSTTAQKLLRITIKASTTPTHAPPPSLRTAGVGQFNAIRFVNCSACLPQPFPTPSVAIIQGATLNLSTRAAYQRGTSCPRLTLVAWPRYSLINLICLDDIHDCHRPRSRISSLLSPPTYARSTVSLLSPLHPSIFPPPPSLSYLQATRRLEFVNLQPSRFMRIVRQSGMRISSSCVVLVSSCCCCLMMFELQFESQCNDRMEKLRGEFLDLRI